MASKAAQYDMDLPVMNSVILHIPHSSKVIPPEVRPQFLLSEPGLSAEILKMTDWYTDELFQLPGAHRVVFPVSRLVVDPERFEDDSQEVMASRGMGVIYTLTSDGRRLRPPPLPALREQLLEGLYHPHHQALRQAVDNALGRTGRALVIDCHSFPSVPLPYEIDQGLDRPDICLGSDSFHTPASLLELAKDALSGHGLTVKVNRPFGGALVPMAHYRRDARVKALMIEVNRSLYMDEGRGAKLASFPRVCSLLGDALVLLASAS